MQVDITTVFSPELDALALRSPSSTFYQTRVWIDSLRHSFPSLNFHCAVARHDETVLGYLPFFLTRKGPIRRLWSMPFGTYGGPVTTEDSSVGTVLLDALEAFGTKIGAHEIGIVDYRNQIQRPKFRREENRTDVIDLSVGFEQVWSQQFDKAKRRQTRKAEREGLSVVEATTGDEVLAYYRIYLERSRQWGQRTVYPPKLLTELFESGKDGGRVRLFLARAGTELLGGHLNLYFKDEVIAWNGVTSTGSRSSQASTLLYSACIEHACKNGYLRYNLGASLGSGTLVSYKESIGAKPQAYRTHRKQSLIGRIASVAGKVLRR